MACGNVSLIFNGGARDKNIGREALAIEYLLKCMWISFEANFYCFLAFVFLFKCVEALFAIAILTEFPAGEAVAIQFQALRFGAVAMLSTSIGCKNENSV